MFAIWIDPFWKNLSYFPGPPFWSTGLHCNNRENLRKYAFFDDFNKFACVSYTDGW